MKFKIKQRVYCSTINKECLVVGTKVQPHLPSKNMSPYNTQEMFPDNGMDYILMMKDSSDDIEIKYKGYFSDMEENLKPIT